MLVLNSFIVSLQDKIVGSLLLDSPQKERQGMPLLKMYLPIGFRQGTNLWKE